MTIAEIRKNALHRERTAIDEMEDLIIQYKEATAKYSQLVTEHTEARAIPAPDAKADPDGYNSWSMNNKSFHSRFYQANATLKGIRYQLKTAAYKLSNNLTSD